MRPHGYASSDRTPEHLPKVYPGPAPGARPGPYDDEGSPPPPRYHAIRLIPNPFEAPPSDLRPPILEAMASAWEAGRKAGHDHERDMWRWQAGTLRERPSQPRNPYAS